MMTAHKEEAVRKPHMLGWTQARRVVAAVLPGLALVPFVAAAVAARQPQGTPVTYPTLGEFVREDPRFDALVPRDARIEVLGSGFEWTEGPIWIKNGGYLLFSDIPNNAIMKWKADQGISLFMKPAG